MTLVPDPARAAATTDLALLTTRLEVIAGTPPSDALATARELLAAGEATLINWLLAHGKTPTDREVEGFRLLALHRQGAKGEPSFNACRETARELAYHFNLITLEPEHADTPRRLKLMAMIARHLALFVSGKLEIAGLGDFCCASRPIRSAPDAER